MLLNCHTFYSHTYGTLGTKQLIGEAQALGYTSLALTDINNVCTAIDFVHHCGETGIRPLLGIDFRNMDESAALMYIGVCKDNRGLAELNAHLTHHLHSKEPFPRRAPEFEHAFVIYPFQTRRFNELRENEYLGVRPEDIPHLIMVPEGLLRKKAVALYTVSFKDKEDYYQHCLLRAIDKNALLSKLEQKDAGSRNEFLIAPEELRKLYENYPCLIRNTEALMEQCEISFDYTQSKNKKHFFGSADADNRMLRELTMRGLPKRYPLSHKHYDEALMRIEKELRVTAQKDFTSYFLMAWDVVRYAKEERGFFHAGRGSGANSIVSYCLGITDVDPIELDLYFERFLNMHRSSPPDFDIDFSWKDRDDIIQYIFNKFGYERTAMLGSHSQMKFRAVTRELGKVYGLPKGEIDRFIENIELESHIPLRKGSTQIDIYKHKILRYGQKLMKFPRHLSVHASGLVISHEPLFHFTATSMPPKGFPITHFDMYTADKFKLHKLDILSQRGLGHIKDTIEIVRRNRSEEVDIHRVHEFTEDKRLNDLLAKGDTIGCFYIESPAMRQLMRKLQCNDFRSLVAASSIIRPGVSDSGMAREYTVRALKHKAGEQWKGIHPKLDALLAETYGVMVYQEDIIKVAHEFVGLTLAGADILRRAMAWKFRIDDGFQKTEAEYFEKCKENGYTKEVADEVWRQLLGFASFSFCKAHSASYAVESYQSLFLKANYPLEFMVGVINNFGGFYSTEFYMNEAKRLGGTMHAPCLNRSEYLTCIDGTDIFLGFVHVKQLEEQVAKEIVAEREKNGPYADLPDFCERVPTGLEQLFILVKLGAFRFTRKTKRQLLWEGAMLLSDRKVSVRPSTPLFPQPVKNFTFPPLPQSYREDALQEVELLSFPICSWFDLLTTDFRGEIKSRDMINNVGRTVTMAGCLTNTRLTSTKYGQSMQFGSFRDDEGYTFEAVLFPPVYQRCPLLRKGVYALTGVITQEFDVAVLELQSWEIMEISFEPAENPKANHFTKPAISGKVLEVRA